MRFFLGELKDLIDSPDAPLEQDCSTYKLRGWLGDCREKAEDPGNNIGACFGPCSETIQHSPGFASSVEDKVQSILRPWIFSIPLHSSPYRLRTRNKGILKAPMTA